MATSPTLTGYSFGADQPAASSAEPGPAPGAATQKELEELVSPIALYPDLLVARILVASTYPDQVVEAHRWLQQNSKPSSRTTGRSGECATLGPQHQVVGTVLSGSTNDERQLGMDFGARRSILQPA